MKRWLVFTLFWFLVIPYLAYAQGDVFQVKTPNVMIIFDTSSSMEMSINLNSKGESIWKWYGLNYETSSPHGGNHPDSKLYQAKDALKKILEDIVKDKVNLGFSTYAQVRIPKVRGQYKVYKKTANATTTKYYRYKRYYRWRTAYYGSSSSVVTYEAWSIYNYSFIDHKNNSWGSIDSPVTVGFIFNELVNIHDKKSEKYHPPYISENNFKKETIYTVKWQVTAITHYPEQNKWKFTYKTISDPYNFYEEKKYYVEVASLGTCGSDKEGSPWPKQQNDTPKWSTYFSDNVGDNNEYYTGGNGRPANHWQCWDNEVPGSGEKWEWKSEWVATSGSTCPDTRVTTDSFGTWTWNLVSGTCFDYSDYKYPGNPSDTTKYPHTWSYYHIDGSGWWKFGDQKTPFYPAPEGNPGESDNHHFFINFPDDKDPSFKQSDRTTILNKILSYLDLTPVQNPQTGKWWTKLPIQAIAGRTGLTSATTAVDSQKQTPLADSLKWAFKYFYDYINEYQCPGCSEKGDPSSKEKFGETLCRGNYIILLTDGLESCRYSGGKPDYDAAPAEAAKLFSINVTTFVIGFGQEVLQDKGYETLNKIARAGSGNKHDAYFTKDFDTLYKALQSIFQTITGQYYGRSNPVITKARDRLYRGNFEIKDGDYLGHLMAWDANKQTGVLAPDFAWDAGEVMKTFGRGKVYTWTDTGLNPTLKEFKASESSLYTPENLVNPGNDDIDGNGITEDFVDEQTIINFTLDPNYNDGINGAGYYKGNRAIDWKLGDIYHSTPVVIAEPAFFFTENNYPAFYSANKNRDVVIYVGANDGMLHAFNNTDGSEKFAIIPRSLLGKLKNLRSVHDFYVDSSPKAYDVYFKGEGKWKTVLISGLRGGGNYYFALDVTDPNNPKALWEWTHESLGQTWAKPDIGRVKIGGETRFVAFITGGYTGNPSDNKGNSFHVVDIEDLTVYRSFTVGNPADGRKVPSGPIAFDANQDGFIDYVYFGDIKGGLWKVNVSSSNYMDWDIYQLFQVSIDKLNIKGEPKPIYHTPAVTKNDEGKILLFFGTGDEMNLATANTFNYFFEIWDQGTEGKENWRVDLIEGEKILASPVVANAVVYFTTWVYMPGGEFCGAGEGRLYGRTVTKMGAPGGEFGLVTLDPNTGKWTSPQSYMSLGAGIPSAPVVTNGMVYVSTSLNANKVIQIPIPPWAVARMKSWREVF